MNSFSLWLEPWIPVMASDGVYKEVGIRTALIEAHQLREVFDPSPLITVALHRLLLTVIYRVFDTQTEEQWAKLWSEGQFNQKCIDEYGEQWAEHFDLLHPKRPFYQVQAMMEEKTHPITALVIEAASGNNPTLFDHGRVEGLEMFPLSRAACHLVAHQLFAIGGGVSKPFNRMDGPLTKGIVAEANGRTLFETLLLNLIPLEYWMNYVPHTAGDRPFWEIDQPSEPVKNGTTPLGPMHYLTWQSRQIHLFVDPTSGFVTGCQIRQRFALPKNGERYDPGKPYRLDEKAGYQPFKLDKERAVWQSTHILLQATNTDTARPFLTEWLAVVKLRGFWHGLNLPPQIGMSVSGLTMDPRKPAKVELWRRERLPMSATFLDQPDLVDDLGEFLVAARRVEKLLHRASLALACGMSEAQHLPLIMKYMWTGKLDKKEIEVLEGYEKLARSLGMVRSYWPALETSFRRAMEELPINAFEEVRSRWYEDVVSAATRAFRSGRDALIGAPAPNEVVARVESIFLAKLRKFITSTEEGASDDAESVG